MKNFKQHLRIALLMTSFFALNTLTGQTAEKSKSNRLETRLLVQTFMQDSLMNELGVQPDLSNRVYIADFNSKLDVPKKIYINDLIIEIVTNADSPKLASSNVLEVTALDVEKGLALVSTYSKKSEGKKDRDQRFSYEYSSKESVADLSYED